MARMNELFQELWGDDAEKTASANQQLTTENDYIDKVASVMSDDEIAQAEQIIEGMEAEKQATDYEFLGRFMARGFMDELGKLAADGDGMVGLTGSAQTQSKADGKTPALLAGGDTSPGSQRGPESLEAKGDAYKTPQDGGKIVASIKAKLDALHQPESPTQAQDSMALLKKMVDAAKVQKTKQQVAEVPADI